MADIEQIKQLKHRYCACCDERYDPDGIAALFTEDGVWDGGPFGRAEGREGFREFFREVSNQVDFANHYVTNPIIEIDGNSATGCWDLWQPMVMAPDPAAPLARGEIPGELRQERRRLVIQDSRTGYPCVVSVRGWIREKKTNRRHELAVDPIRFSI